MRQREQTRVVMLIVMCTLFIVPFMSNAINLAIPAIGTEFKGSQAWLNWVVSVYLLASAAFLMPFGRFGDLYGRKRVFLVGMALFAVATVGCALAPSLPLLVLFRAGQGMGSAMVFSTSMAILTAVVPEEVRGKALGLCAAATYTGLSAGPVLGGFITSAFNWRGIFLFVLVISLIVLGLTVTKLRGEWRSTQAKHLDIAGGIFCTSGIGLALYGLSDLAGGMLYVAALVVGLVLLVIFIARQLAVAEPLFDVRFFIGNRVFAFSSLAALINYSATFALGFMISLYLQRVLGISTNQAGLILLSQPIIMALLSPWAGSLSDRIQPSVLASLGMGASALGLLFFIFLGSNTAVWLIVVNLAFIGLGFALFSSPNTNAIMSSVAEEHYGVASSTLATMRMVGQSLSMAIVALITSLLMRGMTLESSGYATQFMLSLRTAFLLFGILCMVGVFASLARGKIGTLEP